MRLGPEMADAGARQRDQREEARGDQQHEEGPVGGGERAGAAPSSPESIANLPTKPDSGGRPVSSSVQIMKLRPRKATPAGLARP